MFNRAQLKGLAKEVEDTIVKIMERRQPDSLGVEVPDGAVSR